VDWSPPNLPRPKIETTFELWCVVPP